MQVSFPIKHGGFENWAIALSLLKSGSQAGLGLPGCLLVYLQSNTRNEALHRIAISVLLNSRPYIHYNLITRQRDILGSGAFGTVYRGVWSLPTTDSVKEEVAVKTMENGAGEEDKVKFLQEAAIMGQFNHTNIVKILGIVQGNEV